MSKNFYKKGLHFECQGSGKCCLSRGEYGYVYLTKSDAKRMAKVLELTVAEFKKQYCRVTGGVLHLIQPEDSINCVFLQDNRCSVYEGRPTQCRTWPFWPENMNPKAWKRDVINFCPGASVKTKKSLKSPEVIAEQLKEQAASEKELFGE
ncbi:MAG: YkgJ family cysteine cluster protein [Bdellovibrionaceae bacterium]|nr:YkgJ family cysteine cluster protein [Pseudobdellovibrionaceae bacterium]